MSTITLPNIRVSSDLTAKLKLKDGGVALDWSTLSNIRVSIYSDAQRALAGRCSASIDAEDPTLLVCTYAANKPQYVGVNRVVVSAKYMNETKTYDKPAFNFVRWTDDQAGQQITIDDPDVDVEIEVEDISSSILQEAVDDAFAAADRANDAAAAAEHMVDIHTGPAGKSPYIGENGHWYEWDEETDQYVDTETNAKGDTGETPDITIGTVTTAEPGTPAAATMTGTPEDPVLNLTIPKGAVGATPNFTIGTVTTGEPGTPVVVTLTGTPEAPVLNITIPQGMQGNTGSSVDYPYELVNNLTTNDATKGLSAQQGKVLKDELTQLEHEVHNLSGKYYGIFEDAGSLPEGDATGYAFVGASEPFAIWNFDGEEWADSGATVDGITGEPGVGFASVDSPSPADGTVIITLSNGDTITLDLNHTHSQYTKVYVCANQAEYDAITTKDSMTFYLIPEVALYFGNTLIIAQTNPLPYTPVAWIATDGVAYINTGIKGNSPMSAYCKMLPVAPSSGTAYFFGHRSSTNGRFVFLMIGSNKYAGFTYASSAYTTAVDVSTSVDNQTPIEAKTFVKDGEQQLFVRQQGESQYTDYHDSRSATVSDGIDIYLFCYNNQGSASTPESGTKCYGAKIYSDATFGTMVFNGIPCYFNGEYGMWDLVSNSFFGNAAGSGAFTGPSI